MQLINILLITVGLLAAFSGAIVFFGALKANRARSAWFFLAAVFAAVWSISIANLLACKDNAHGLATLHANWTFVSAIMLDAAFLGFSAWDIKHGKPTTIIFFILGIILSAFIMIHPEWLYSEIAFTNAGNGPVFNMGPLFFAYGVYFGIVVPVITFFFFRQYMHSRSKRNRVSNLIALISYDVASGIVLVADFIALMLHNFAIGWLGPLAIAVLILMIYYVILRYRAINLSVRWLQLFSYVVVVASIAIVYMIVFSIVFAALFRGSTPSIEVIVLNFIMILIFIALMPAMNGLINFIRRLIVEQHPRAEQHFKSELPATTHPFSAQSSMTKKPKTEHKQDPKHHAKH